MGQTTSYLTVHVTEFPCSFFWADAVRGTESGKCVLLALVITAKSQYEGGYYTQQTPHVTPLCYACA